MTGHSKKDFQGKNDAYNVHKRYYANKRQSGLYISNALSLKKIMQIFAAYIVHKFVNCKNHKAKHRRPKHDTYI